MAFENEQRTSSQKTAVARAQFNSKGDTLPANDHLNN
jgi:hypothetical protein